MCQDNDTLSYIDLFKASELFEGDFYAYDKAWLQAEKKVEWENLFELSTNQIKDDVIGFLNLWKCRLHPSNTLAERIKKAHKDTISYIEALQDVTIEDWTPDIVRMVEEKNYSSGELLQKTFARYSNIGERFRYVAASKLLHFLLPKLIVMWDNSIAPGYGVPMNSKWYVKKFISKMREMANEAIESYQMEKRVNRERAVAALYNFRPPKTIAKLLDEYNYMKFRRGIKFC